MHCGVEVTESSTNKQQVEPDKSPVDNEGKDPHALRLQLHYSRLKEHDISEQFKKQVEALLRRKNRTWIYSCQNLMTNLYQLSSLPMQQTTL
jgi:hypothetical protein